MKSILLHVYEDTGFESRLQAALAVARSFEGHITCLHATPFEDYLDADPWVAARLPEEFSDKMKEMREELQARIEARLAVEGVAWDWVHQDDRMSSALIRYSILSDVVVLSQAGHAFERSDPRPLAAKVATSSRAPVLAVPEQFGQLRTDAPVVIAWNGTPESAAAARAALPLLRLAPQVRLLQVREKLSRYPRDLVARYLSRHGVHVDVMEIRPTHASIAEDIADVSMKEGAGLVVMGAYGHSRLREFLLGGVTHDLIANCPIPLLLAH
jgi:nucleotide-binding universal stress UspA family protein